MKSAALLNFCLDSDSSWSLVDVTHQECVFHVHDCLVQLDHDITLQKKALSFTGHTPLLKRVGEAACFSHFNINIVL